MKTYHLETWILPILDEIIAYLHNNWKNLAGKKFNFQQPVAKKVQNLNFFGEIIAYIWDQLQKIAHLKKSRAKKNMLWQNKFLFTVPI